MKKYVESKIEILILQEQDVVRTSLEQEGEKDDVTPDFEW